MRVRLVLTGAIIAGAVFGMGCRKRSEPTVQVTTTADKTPAGGTGSANPTAGSEATAVDPNGAAPSPSGSEGTNEPAIDPRETAMDAAYVALTTGDDGAPEKVRALKADALPVLARAIESENVMAMSGALPILAAMAEPGAKELIVKSVANSAASIRALALDASAAGSHHLPIETVVALAKDPEYEVRATVCDTFASYKSLDDQAIATMFALLADDQDVVRAACSTAFGKLATPAVWFEKLAAQLDEKSVPARDGAVRALGELNFKDAFDLIRGRLADPDAAVVASAVAAISRFADEASAREIEPFLKDERRSVRIEAAAALFRLPKQLVRNWAYEALKDREPAVRIEAASALERYPEDPETYIRLHALLRDEEATVREVTALSLETLHDPRSFAALLGRLQEEPDDTVRARLVVALGACDKERAVPNLIDRIPLAKGAELTAVATTLEALTGQGISPDQAKWKAWYDSTRPAAPGSQPAVAPEGAPAAPAGAAVPAGAAAPEGAAPAPATPAAN